MPREWVPSNELFRNRLYYLVEERGIERVARQRGRTPATIRAWLRGDRRPSGRTRRNIVVAGRRLTGPVAQGRQDGRFTTTTQLVDPRVIRMEEVLNERYRQRREVAIREATTNRQQQMAEALPVAVDREALIDMDTRRQRLIESEYYGDEYWDEYGYEFDTWDDWRSSYAELAG